MAKRTKTVQRSACYNVRLTSAGIDAYLLDSMGEAFSMTIARTGSGALDWSKCCAEDKQAIVSRVADQLGEAIAATL